MTGLFDSAEAGDTAGRLISPEQKWETQSVFPHVRKGRPLQWQYGGRGHTGSLATIVIYFSPETLLSQKFLLFTHAWQQDEL